MDCNRFFLFLEVMRSFSLEFFSGKFEEIWAQSLRTLNICLLAYTYCMLQSKYRKTKSIVVFFTQNLHVVSL